MEIIEYTSTWKLSFSYLYNALFQIMSSIKRSTATRTGLTRIAKKNDSEFFSDPAEKHVVVRETTINSMNRVIKIRKARVFDK